MMSQLQHRDLAVWPVYLTVGRKSQEQVLLAHVWRYALEGAPWTLSELSNVCGCSVNRAMLDKLVAEGVLLRTEEGERKNSKPCYEYGVNADFVPSHAAPAKKKAKKGRAVYAWALEACEVWKRRGVIAAADMERGLLAAVREHGHDVVLAALRRYADKGERYGDPTIRKFTQNMSKWIVREEQPSGRAASFGDLLETD